MSSANSTSEAVCWCASDIKCPHRIEAKLTEQEGEIERAIDDILRRFDRNAIRKFLKTDLDGNTKASLKDSLKDIYGKSTIAKSTKTKSVPKAEKTVEQHKSPLEMKGGPAVAMNYPIWDVRSHMRISRATRARTFPPRTCPELYWHTTIVLCSGGYCLAS